MPPTKSVDYQQCPDDHQRADEESSSFCRNSKNNQQHHPMSFCILWSPIPVITWIFPFIGHMGIANSRGVAYDFAGPYMIGEYKSGRRMAFGPVTRVLCVDDIVNYGGAEVWDKAIYDANDVYRGRVHNLFCDNCHSHVGNALNRLDGLQIFGFKKFNMVNLCLILFVRGRFVSVGGFLSQFIPFAVLLILYLLLIK
uniref:Transmembrane protein 222 n=1 Tax=Leptocylindrus danicus TaxID=163516 RepID=A0A7S2K0K8_9STRA|mmetsp:Transcript_15473/g.22854  ORF Transcript_15473/g.22854 Transcript_15473/m.22854 type:complete len:197 (+) Transcript_15473:228-818(+)